MLFGLALCSVLLLSVVDAAKISCNSKKTVVSGLKSYSTLSDALGDEQFVNFQLKCLRQRGPCNTTGKKIKACLPDYLADGCSQQCTVQQQNEYSEIVDFMQQNHAAKWAEVVQIYGPDADK